MISLGEATENLKAKKNKIFEMGGVEPVERQHKSGKLTARERVDLLVDPGTFYEFGILTHHTSLNPDMRGKSTPADGVICGFGDVNGRTVAVVAYDFTVMAGSMGYHGEKKVERIRKFALERRVPLVWLLDSAGARIQEIAGSHFAGSGGLFKEQVTMSGVIPQVAAVMGPTAAGTSYIPALSDFVPMVKEIGTMALAGPTLVKAAVGETIDFNSLGGSKVHCEISGVGHLECEDDRQCIEAIKNYLSYLPSNFKAPLPQKGLQSEVSQRSVENLGDEIFGILPDSPLKPYDMKKVIHWLGDEDQFFEIQPNWAKSLIIGFFRIGGFPIGVVANQPSFMGGALDVDASDKAAHFINLCDSFGVPLLFLHDCPGFIVGSRVEHAGIIRHGAKMLYAVSRLTVPKISVVVRKSYGAGYYVMCGRGYDPDLIVAWPNSEISLMSPQGAVNIITRNHDDPEKREKMVEHYKSIIGGERSAMESHIDDVIDPRETAKLIFQTLKMLVPKHNEERAKLQTKKHGVSPV